MVEHYHNEGRSHGGLYFIVGAVAVVVAILAFLYFGGQLGDTGDRKVDVNITTPKPATPPATR